MVLARRLAAVVAAALAIALGVHGVATQTSARREPTVAQILRPLAGAPIPGGTVVQLLPPSGPSDPNRGTWLMEAAWQRRDLRWQLAEPGERCVPTTSFCVVVGEASEASGWRVAARLVNVTILRRVE